jgi:glucose-1-phosphate adenylyltransferase
VRTCIAEGRFSSGTIQGNSWVETGSAKAAFSMVQAGCTIDGEVIDSTLLQGAHIANGAVIEGCLVGEGAIIGEGAQLHDVVIDHGASVPAGHIQTGGTF